MESTLRIPAETKLIETFGWEPGQGYPRLDRHLRRLAHSAAILGFRCDIPAIRAALATYESDMQMRCRLTLACDGRIEVTRSPMAQRKPFWMIQIAPQRLDAADPWLRHKTTNRALYDDARAALPAGVDELIFLNERDELCEGAITNIFVETQTGEMLTPPLSSGCLPGIYRQEQLDSGACREAVLRLADLEAAHWIGVGNALRGAICAKFQR
ncbi:4-amino-4-deoxychorismate lyase [Loktanella sp. D2R18]|uniref:aminotransferase class IV family protein n=1 Tax=Rhodobacterales TaxID=204455 RepID=UPI000DEB53F8|nr:MULTISPECIES: aminotransferase class IV family protein [Rhodobacterales]MDO6589346.1 aminotransferase class IV family protein [Yoonia sp. 1_MG-2023]RBW45239.1 4-amino-4-deoxychorismate lyase [Loktanella sp. D2R18]